MNITFTQLHPSIADIITNLNSYREHVGEAVWSITGEGPALMGEQGTLSILKRLTPRSEHGVSHIADYWTRQADRGVLGFIETIQIFNAHPLAEKIIPYLEFGTSPHEIRGNPILHFFLEDGKEIWTRLVHHPGTKPYKMVETARASLLAQIDILEQEVAKRVIEDIEKGK